MKTKTIFCAECENEKVTAEGDLCDACEDFQNSQQELFLQNPVNPFKQKKK